MTSNFKYIPVIDLSLAKSPITRPKLLQELHYALTCIGFLYITNHDVPQDVISDLKHALPTLFALDPAEKEEVALHNSPHFLGYSQVGSETTAGVADKREQFEFATELPDLWRVGLPLYERLKGPNQWPLQDPSLRSVIRKYIHELTNLSERFLRLVAEALSLDPETLFSFLSEQHRLKLVHYPASDLSSDPNIQGVGPHKDSSGWWTFLLQASPPTVKGLQVLNKTGEWIDVPVIDDTFVVNIGQAFEVVTHGVCKATTHRVLSGLSERYSVPFFQGVRGSLTKEEAVGTLKNHFAMQKMALEATEGASVDSAFLRGRYDTWGESQLRTKIRSHRDVGQMFYADVFHDYVNDDS
ncbi:Oxoglutarate/iron-dependent dioxygenase [Penicillium robsamsonii]|uniref:Oxoglutarate/iron-dependent dioxygenase n=1 Tax=Penicillium robsamsonii TaxID=1792511 RepID=UPI0025486629|nr:Oxoglutarate/iron-dependent dioxygenase [Penicillium robsamsonii]KAJ5836735.1 Oxoglutarate/iron-dependent dioxygenase [Penicillium robsamsonii]